MMGVADRAFHIQYGGCEYEPTAIVPSETIMIPPVKKKIKKVCIMCLKGLHGGCPKLI
jgi:hypothetical protein